MSSSWAHAPTAAKKENKFIIAIPVINLHEKADATTPFVSQGIYGQAAKLIKKTKRGWGLIETEDGYQGFAKLEGLIADDPRWRTSKRLVKVSAVSGLVYPIADTERPALMRLPFGARIELAKDLDANNDRWLNVQLVDGRKGFIQRGDVEKPHIKSLDEMILLSQKFMQRPYIWGGNSSEGFDCSGYVQTLYKEMGILLPRDSRPQAASEKVEILDNPKQAGELLFFGKDKITHVGLHLGNGKLIHSSVKNHQPRVTMAELDGVGYDHLLAIRKPKLPEYSATISPITADIEERMQASWQDKNPVPMSDLRYIQLNHWGFDGYVHQGELIVHQKVANEVVDIFAELFNQQYPIEKMLLIDAYQANDARACEDNNTSAFCSRPNTSQKNEWSVHSYGLAIDLNPLLNPYKGNQIVPSNGKIFLNRALDSYGLINKNDAAYQAFTSRGWQWDGDWQKARGYVDYQHFYKLPSETL